MNLERVFVRVAVLCLPLMFIIGSCKKKRAFKEENGQSAEDVRRVQSQNDEAVKDINIAIMEQSLLRGRGTSESEENGSKTNLCGVDVDTLTIYQGITKLNYNGTSCNGVRKTGQIVISITDYPLKKWKHQGCLLKLEFTAYKITGVDGRSIQIDGTEYLKNESGNTWYEMQNGLNAKDLVQTHTGEDLKITFDGNNTAIFNINRRLSFNYVEKSKITTCKIEGMGSSNGLNNLDNWGQNRDGKDFTTQVNTPVLWKSNCGSSSPVDGEVILKVEGKDFEMKCKFGVDQEGNSVSSDNSCPFGWKASWSYKKKTSNRVFAYS